MRVSFACFMPFTHVAQTYLSFKTSNMPRPPVPVSPGVKPVAQIERLTPHSIIFNDNTTLTHIDTIILATGYKYHIPYLTMGGHLTMTTSSSMFSEDTQ